MPDENESDEIAFEATSCDGMCPGDPVDRVPRSIKGIARERLLDFFPGVRTPHVSGTAGVEASTPRALANAVYETHDVRDRASKGESSIFQPSLTSSSTVPPFGSL
jgi:hypothetical protein